MAHGDRLYLSHILDAADRIEHYLAGVELVAFLDDFLRQDGVIRQLAIIGEAVKKLPAALTDGLDAIVAGELMYAIDQQQYLQGYLPVVFLHLYKTNLNTVGGGLPVLTGPGIVDKSNAAAVKDLAAKGTR